MEVRLHFPFYLKLGDALQAWEVTVTEMTMMMLRMITMAVAV